MFNNNSEYIKIPSPYLGINTNAKNKMESAKYIENMLADYNDNCVLRYGTNLVTELENTPDKIFTDTISIMSYLSSVGTSQKIVYQNYLKKIPSVVTDLEGRNINVISISDVKSKIEITLDETSFSEIKKILFNGIKIYVSQTSEFSFDIANVTYGEEDYKIVFEVPYSRNIFNIQTNLDGLDGLDGLDEDDDFFYFELWVERGALYKLENNIFDINPLIEDLDPNVIISHINYQGNLLIANGVDSVFIYDGETIEVLKYKVPISINGQVTKNNNDISFTIMDFQEEDITKHITNGSFIYLNGNKEKCKITNIAKEELKLTFTLENIELEDQITKIFYEKPLPSFSFLTVIHNRIWAVGPGRTDLNSFRSDKQSMFVYYCKKSKSIFDWADEQSGIIPFIDLSTNINTPDNLEAIVHFHGKVLFLGRETTQIYTGYDPTFKDDGRLEDLELPLFKIEKVLKVGILQKNMFVEIPNDILFLSKYGIVSASLINEYQQLAISYSFSNNVHQYIKKEIENIITDRDFRGMRCFLYPYSRFIGFKINNNCFIYQLSNKGFWSVFTMDFAQSTGYFYDNVDRNLYLGFNGKILVYADKQYIQNFTNYDNTNLLWKIHYSWLHTDTTWNNEKVYILCRSLKEIEINLNIYVNFFDGESFQEKIKIEQCGALYGDYNLDSNCYSYKTNNLPYELVRFVCDSMNISLHGSTSEQFILDSLYFSGGSNNAT